MQYAGRQVAVLFDETSGHRALALDIRARLRDAGMNEAYFSVLSPQAEEMDKTVNTLKTSKIGIAFLAGGPDVAVEFLKSAKAAGLTLQLTGTAALASDAFRKSAGELSDGVILSAPVHPATLETSKALRENLRRAGHRPTYAMISAYAAVKAWADAVSAAKNVEPLTVAAKLHEIKLDGPLGPFNFDIKGDPTLPPYKIYRWSNDALVPVPDPADNSCPHPPGKLPEIDPSTL